MKLSDLQWSKKFANSWPSSFRELCSFFNGNKISSNRTIAFRTTTRFAVAAIVSKTWRSIRRWRLKICNFKKHLRHQKILLQKFKGGYLNPKVFPDFFISKLNMYLCLFTKCFQLNPNHEIWLFMNSLHIN